MTEDEAKTKWCPFSRELFIFQRENIGPGHEGPQFAAGFNRGEKKASVGSMCFGSACMAWQSSMSQAASVVHKSSTEHYTKFGYKIEPCPIDENRIIVTPPPSNDGYCGLARNS